jgi:hypothetical protein
MAKYEITAPDGAVYEVEAPDDAKEADVLAYAQSQFNQPKESGLGEQAGNALSMLARGMAAPTVGAIGGGMLAGPAGALAGSLAVPAGDVLTAGYNALAPENYQIQYPSTAIQNLLTKAGMPVPESTTDRALVAGGSALGGAGGQLSGLSRLATTAQTQTGRNIAGQLSQMPTRQLAASAPAGAVSQAVTETTDSPTLGMVAGAATALPFGFGASSSLAKKPSIDDIKSQAAKQYDVAKLSGLEFKNNAFKQNAIKIQKTLMEEGLDKDLHPSVNAALNRLVKDNTPKTLQNVETLRKIAKAPASSINADERRLAQIMVEKLDDFVDNAQPNQLVSKQDINAPEALKNARKLWSQAKKAEILDDVFNSAELRATANFSQSGMENALRRKLVTLADNKRLMRTFTPDERKAITEAAKGGNIQNVLRFVGKLAPTGIVSGGGSVGLGYLMGGPLGAAAAPIVGGLARTGAEQIGLRNFDALQRRLLTGGQPPNQSLYPYSTVTGRGLLSGAVNQPNTLMIDPITVTPEDIEQ